jgi:hypothetical protein
LNFRDTQTNAAKHLTSDLPFVSREENAITLGDLQFGTKRFLFGRRKKLHDRRFPFAVFDLDKGKSLRAKGFGDCGQVVHLSDGNPGKSLCINRLYHTARIEGTAKHLEFTCPEDVFEIDYVHSEPAIRFIATESTDCFPIRHTIEWCLDIDLSRGLENGRKHSFGQAKDIFRPDE